MGWIVRVKQNLGLLLWDNLAQSGRRPWHMWHTATAWPLLAANLKTKHLCWDATFQLPGFLIPRGSVGGQPFRYKHHWNSPEICKSKCNHARNLYFKRAKSWISSRSPHKLIQIIHFSRPWRRSQRDKEWNGKKKKIYIYIYIRRPCPSSSLGRAAPGTTLGVELCLQNQPLHRPNPSLQRLVAFPPVVLQMPMAFPTVGDTELFFSGSKTAAWPLQTLPCSVEWQMPMAFPAVGDLHRALFSGSNAQTLPCSVKGLAGWSTRKGYSWELTPEARASRQNQEKGSAAPGR